MANENQQQPTPQDQTTPPIPEGKISLKDLNKPAASVEPVKPEAPVLPADQTQTPPAEQTPPADNSETPEPGEETPQDPEPPAPADPEDVQAQLEFFQELDRLHGGEPIAVEYGDVLPSSLEGMLLRERAIEERAYQTFETKLKERDPRAVAYMMHRAKGGTDEEFFTRRSSVLPDIDTFKENISLKKQVFKEDLMSKGLSEEYADILIQNAETKGTLDADAEAAYNRRMESDRLQMEELERQALREQQEYQARVKEIDSTLGSAVNSSNLALVIPDKEKAQFLAFVKEHVQSDGEKFYIAQEIDKSSIDRLTEALYLQFKKGDLSSIIQRKANTLNVKRNQLVLGRTRQANTTQPPEPAQQKKKTLGEIDFSPHIKK